MEDTYANINIDLLKSIDEELKKSFKNVYSLMKEKKEIYSKELLNKLIGELSRRWTRN